MEYWNIEHFKVCEFFLKKVTLFETLQMLMFVFTPYLWVCNILIHVVWFLHKIHNFVYNFFKRKKRGNASGRIVLFLLFCFNECKFHSLKQNGGIVLSLFQGYTVQLFKNCVYMLPLHVKMGMVLQWLWNWLFNRGEIYTMHPNFLDTIWLIYLYI
jgi:hypothetical protein